MSWQLFDDIGALMTLQKARQKGGRKLVQEDLDIRKKAVVISHKGLIQWIGPKHKIPKEFRSKIKKSISMGGRTVSPGLVECHTHCVFAGDRASEFEMRNQGVSYLEIAQKGGGILSTMRSVRAAKKTQLQELTQKRVDHFVSQGVTTLEIKSGYGLSLNDEIKSLQVAEAMHGPLIVTTFLGAHAKPPEFVDHQSYLNYLQSNVLPAVLKRTSTRRVDIFIEKNFFEKDMSRKFLLAAKNLGFEVAIHGDQLTLSGGSELAVELEAQSVDHVIQVDDPIIKKLANSNTTAVLLPSADLYMKCAYPPARKLIDAGARVALATDYNPGSSPSQELQLVGVLARLKMGMSLPEVWGAYTVGAAFALGLQDQIGSLDQGMSCDLVSWDCDWDQMFYSVGAECAHKVFRRGQRIN